MHEADLLGVRGEQVGGRCQGAFIAGQMDLVRVQGPVFLENADEPLHQGT